MARQMGRGAEVASRFSFSRRKERSRYCCFFFPCSPWRNDVGVAAPKGLPEDGAAWCSLLFQAELCCLFVRASLRGKSYATSMAREAETIFTLFPRRSFYIRSVTSPERPTDVWGRRSFVTEMCVFFLKEQISMLWRVKRPSLMEKATNILNEKISRVIKIKS